MDMEGDGSRQINVKFRYFPGIPKKTTKISDSSVTALDVGFSRKCRDL
jgi:hypothetical protein